MVWARIVYLERVLVGEEVDDLERVRDDADGQELLAVVAALHHQAKGDMCASSRMTILERTHLSTNRSTMGICAFLNCFFA